MALAARLEQYLNGKDVVCQTLALALNPQPTFDAVVLACGQPQSKVLKATLLIDLEGVVMAVHSYDSALDTDALNALANGLLKQNGIGDEFNPDNLVELCQRLGLIENDLEGLTAAVSAVSPDLDALARSLAT